MAFPNKLEDITTNLTPEELQMIKFALDGNHVEWLKGGSLYGPSAGGYFKYKDVCYEINEMWEIVQSIYKLDENLKKIQAKSATV